MQAEPTPSWSEENSQTFLDYGRYFVPEREHQLAIIATLIPPRDEPFTVVELCCGEGLLAETILKQRPTSTILGYDGSPAMLEKARQRLAAFGERFQTRHFDLTAPTWRQFEQPVHAVVSSLAIHHLDGAEKQALFVDIYNLLAPGGVFVIADVILPTHKQGWQVAAAAWDRAVMARAQALDGHLAAFEAFRDTEWICIAARCPMKSTSLLPYASNWAGSKQPGSMQSTSTGWTRGMRSLVASKDADANPGQHLARSKSSV